MELANTSNVHNNHNYTKAYGSLSNAFSRLSQEDVVWAIRYLQAKLEDNNTPIISKTILGKNAERLINQLTDISKDKCLLDNGMTPISMEMMQAAKRFIESCPKDDILKDADCFPRMNGTMLICWNKENSMASVNIGESSFTYAITNPENSTRTCGDGSLTIGDILFVYNTINELL